MMMPSVAELTYFFEISKWLNLSQAAKNLYISQPSLTRAIQSLESKVGVELFIRHKKGVTLTPAGKKILVQIKPLLQCWQDAQLQARASHKAVEGHVRIGCNTATGLFLHLFLTQLLEIYPKLDIEIHNAVSNIITQKVIDLSIDIGIVTNPIEYPNLIIRKLNDTETGLWVGDGERKIQDIYSGEAIIICDPELRNTQLIFQKFKTANLKFKRVLKVNNVEIIANLTANGCGIGILPSCFVKTLYEGKLRCIPNSPAISNTLCLIYRKEYTNVEVIKTVISAIQQYAMEV